ncbi:MAG: trypsin-like peptidase domain-containing protein [Oscillospiraceae bacterium]|nr:trypsin-like peptidase domain-containing protein [Oscillospiraceae bacterium]
MFENNYNNETDTRETVYTPVPEPGNQEPDSKKHKNKKKGSVKKLFKAIGLICCIAAISAGSIAGYRYIDENGVPFISDKSDNDSKKEDNSKKDDESTDKESSTTIDRSKYEGKSLVELSKSENALSTQQIYQKVSPSVVGVSSTFEYQSTAYSFFGYAGDSSTQQLTGTGTGIITSSDGYILTNAHVIYDSQYGRATDISIILHDETEYKAEVVGYDEQSDIAVLKVDAADLTAAEFGDSDGVQVGDAALAIGNPLGFDLFGTLTVGYISGVDREISVNDTVMKLIQTDAAINSGNSGGPLINDCGQVIGINSMKMSSSYSSSGASVEGLGFAIPISQAKTIIDDLMSYGYVTGRPQLGITCRDVSTAGGSQQYGSQQGSGQDGSSSGVLVIDVTQDGPADKCGIKAGDIIVGVDGELVTSIQELNEAKNKHSAGDKIRLTIIRDRSYHDVTITLEDQKNSADDESSQNDSEDQNNKQDENTFDPFGQLGPDGQFN